MQEREIQIAGAVVYWSAGPTSRELLESRLVAIGLEKHLPGVRTDAAALKSALLDYCDQHKTKAYDLIVQNHKQQSRNGFEVVAVERGVQSNAYGKVVSAKYDTHSNGVDFERGYDSSVDFSWEGRREINDLFNQHKGKLLGAAVGQMLIGVLQELGGVALRPSGGVYWIPLDSVNAFHQVATIAEECAEKDEGNRVYMLRTAMDEQTVRAVRDAITAEVTAASAQIVTDVQENLVTDDAINRRLLAATELHGRVKQYEDILGEAMTALHSAISIAEQAASAAVAIQESNQVFDSVFAS